MLIGRLCNYGLRATTADSNVRSIYLILSGLGPAALNTLDAELVIRLQEQIKKTLQRPEASHLANLPNLAVLSKMAAVPATAVTSASLPTDYSSIDNLKGEAEPSRDHRAAKSTQGSHRFKY